MQFPRMHSVEQNYPRSQSLNFSAEIARQFQSEKIHTRIRPGMRIAVGVGSRGITNIREILQAVIAELIAAGAKPFLLPAMGSHGGATPVGQEKLLEGYGITSASMGVPIETSMDVVEVGKAFGRKSVVLSSHAMNADGIIILNRVKPHTDFRGTLGSGLQKMLVIGFGKKIGAANAHGEAVHRGYEPVLREYAKVILAAAPVLCGIAILEDQHHATAKLQVVAAEKIIASENDLLEEARALMPRLPLDEIDLLIVDQIGKEISGSGMDTNIIGRDITGYSTSLQPETPLLPRIFRIFVRDLTAATNGNGVGIGLADFTTTRAVRALDKRYTYVNALTAIGLHPAKIPIHFDSDRETLALAIATLAPADIHKLRIVRILNTLSLDRVHVSEGCIPHLKRHATMKVSASAEELRFDDNGNLLPI